MLRSSILKNRLPRSAHIQRVEGQTGLKLMDRIYLAVIVSALLLLVGSIGLYATRTADLLPHKETVGFSGSK